MYYNNEMGRTFKPFPSIPTLLTTHLNCNIKVDMTTMFRREILYSNVQQTKEG